MKKLLLLVSHSRGKKLFLQTYLVMSLVRLGMLLLPFKRLQNFVSRSQQLTFLAVAPQEVNVSSIARAVERSGHYQPGKPMCLAKALTTAVIMNMYGFPHQVNIGVAKSELGKIEAHAWVVFQSQVIVGNLPDLSRYIPMSKSDRGLII